MALDGSSPLNVGQCATLACLLEVIVPKPGNVHRGADFADLTFADFATAAVAVGPAIQRAAAGTPIGQTVYDAVTATRQFAATNVNLGIVLLFAPLAAASAVGRSPDALRQGLRNTLAGLNAEDAAQVYAAIALANPGGMGRVAEADVAEAPPADLLYAMRLAADRDAVARQYANGFTDLFDFIVPRLEQELAAGRGLSDAVIRTQLHVLRQLPDTLIARKCGADMAQQVAEGAEQVLQAAELGEETFHEALADFDFWLRSDGHRRNPGTTADLLAAALFVLLLADRVPRPIRL
ncbi:MAG: triphosphoribosyl-dephospho-CoA synthetase [Pirellula sp.]|nr:triphosphoribosyl-dephospho-CoA synthetase [Pirellula sp.]